MSKAVRMVFACLAIVALLAGCSGGTKTDQGGGQASSGPKYEIDGRDVTALYDAAKKEGKLTLYVGAYAEDQVTAYGGEFKKAFPGIEVEIFRAATGVVFERFLSEARSNKYLADVLIQGDPYALKNLGKEGYLMEYDLPSKDKYDPKFITDKFVYPHSIVYVGLAINSNLVKADDEAEFRKNWKHLMNPKWKGKVGISVPAAGGSSYGPIYMFLGERRNLLGPDFVKGVQANVGKVYTSVIPGTNEVGAGEFAVFVQGSTASVAAPAAQGAPIKLVYPPPTPAIPFSEALVAKAPHPNAAKLYFEWSFGKEGQEKMVQVIGQPSGHKDVTVNPFSKYPWYKDPTEIWVVENVENYLKGVTTVQAEWHELTGVKK